MSGHCVCQSQLLSNPIDYSICCALYIKFYVLCDMLIYVVDDVETVPPKKTDQLKTELDQYLNVCFFYIKINIVIAVCSKDVIILFLVLVNSHFERNNL